MPVLSGCANTTYASGTGVLEPCTGWTYEYLPWPAAVKILVTQFGGTDPAKLSVWSGSEAIVENQDIGVGSDITLPNDLTTHPVTFMAPAGDRLKVRFTSGAANTQFNYIIVVDPVK